MATMEAITWPINLSISKYDWPHNWQLTPYLNRIHTGFGPLTFVVIFIVLLFAIKFAEIATKDKKLSRFLLLQFIVYHFVYNYCIFFTLNRFLSKRRWWKWHQEVNKTPLYGWTDWPLYSGKTDCMARQTGRYIQVRLTVWLHRLAAIFR